MTDFNLQDVILRIEDKVDAARKETSQLLEKIHNLDKEQSCLVLGHKELDKRVKSIETCFTENKDFIFKGLLTWTIKSIIIFIVIIILFILIINFVPKQTILQILKTLN